MPITQANRNVAISTALGPDKLLIVSASISEQLGRPFRMDVDLISDDPNLDFSALVGTNATLRLALPKSRTPRFFNGFLSRFVQTDADQTGGRYRATLVPWLWFLTRTADCRIFQHKTVPDIIKEVFRDHGFTDFEDALSGSYTPWEYCVQYRETDFNFVSRLMEHEGIYYYFKHTDGKHLLVLSDSASAHQPFGQYDTVPYRSGKAGVRDEEHISTWTLEQEVQPGSYTLNDFNFEKPKASLEGKAQIQMAHAQSGFDIYDYPGEYGEQSEGSDYSKIRIEEMHAQQEIVQGQSNARGLVVGCTFTLTNSARRDQNRKYLITAASYHLTGDHYQGGGHPGGGEEEEFYNCTFSAIDATKPFRAARVTPKPLIQGPQTAIVVGPKGEEIYTDQYSRVKVQFHWDRYGKADENSSCWVRVSHPGTAGKGWGSFNIPRIGHEVIIEFLEGDPDLPIITGSVYNAGLMPKMGLPANKTQNGVISRSTPGGTAANYNELRFEDKMGQEQVSLQAEKDMVALVKHDDAQTVGHDRAVTIKHDLASKIQHNETRTITQDHTTTVEKGNQQLTVSTGNQTVNISKGKQTINVEKAIEITSKTRIKLTVGTSVIIMTPDHITVHATRIDLNPG